MSARASSRPTFALTASPWSRIQSFSKAWTWAATAAFAGPLSTRTCAFPRERPSATIWTTTAGAASLSPTRASRSSPRRSGPRRSPGISIPMSERAGSPFSPKTGSLRRWLWLVAGVLVLALFVLGGMALYNRQQRLTPEKLEAARARWASAGLRDYDIEVTVTGGTAGVYHVHVRNGQAVGGTVNGQPFDRLEQAHPWTVAELFHILEA